VKPKPLSRQSPVDSGKDSTVEGQDDLEESMLMELYEMGEALWDDWGLLA
jgi:hypothetical protein